MQCLLATTRISSAIYFVSRLYPTRACCFYSCRRRLLWRFLQQQQRQNDGKYITGISRQTHEHAHYHTHQAHTLRMCVLVAQYLFIQTHHFHFANMSTIMSTPLSDKHYLLLVYTIYSICKTNLYFYRII